MEYGFKFVDTIQTNGYITNRNIFEFWPRGEGRRAEHTLAIGLQ